MATSIQQYQVSGKGASYYVQRADLLLPSRLIKLLKTWAKIRVIKSTYIGPTGAPTSYRIWTITEVHAYKQ